MQKSYRMVLLCLVVMLFGTTLIVKPVSAGEKGPFLFSPQSNSVWVLKESTRKLIFIRFSEPGELWKSKSITIPSEFNLETSELEAVGGRGTSAILYDHNSGKVVLYTVLKDQTILAYPVVDTSVDLN